MSEPEQVAEGAQPAQPPRSRLEPLFERGLGVPGLFVAVYSAIGFSIYFALGVVADRGLGLTPLIFLVSGLLFVLATLSYVEGGAMIRERGGSSSFARHGFNELIAFIAGWAILIDYLIVAALAAISVPHYLTPVASDFGESGWEVGIAAAVILIACVLNVLNITGRGVRERWLVVLALADIALQLAVIVVGALAVFHPDRLTDQLDLFMCESNGVCSQALGVPHKRVESPQLANGKPSGYVVRSRDGQPHSYTLVVDNLEDESDPFDI